MSRHKPEHASRLVAGRDPGDALERHVPRSWLEDEQRDHRKTRAELERQREAAEAEVRHLKQENDELAEQAYQDRSKAQRLTEGLRRIDNWPVDVMVGPATDLRRIKDYARVLLTDSPPDGGGA